MTTWKKISNTETKYWSNFEINILHKHLQAWTIEIKVQEIARYVLISSQI